MLKKYFNKEAFNSKGSPALMATSFSILTLAFGSPVIGGMLGILAVGSINHWQEAATGKPIWKPKISKTFGL